MVDTIKTADNKMQDKTHLKNLDLTPSNTIKVSTHTERETLDWLKELSITTFNKDISHVVLIRDGKLGRKIKLGAEEEALYTKETLSLIDKILDNLNKSSNSYNTSVLIIDNKVIVDGRSTFQGFAIRQNDKPLVTARDESSNFSSIKDWEDYMSYRSAQAKINTGADYTKRGDLYIVEGERKFCLSKANYDPHIIIGEIENVFNQVGLEFD
jgi:hypothetical protein